MSMIIGRRSGFCWNMPGSRCCRDSFKVEFWSSNLELYKLCRPWRGVAYRRFWRSRWLREWTCLAGRRWDHMPRLRAGPIPLNAFTDRRCDGHRPLPTHLGHLVQELLLAALRGSSAIRYINGHNGRNLSRFFNVTYRALMIYPSLTSGVRKTIHGLGRLPLHLSTYSSMQS